MCVLFLNTMVDKDPSGWCVILVSKKGSVLSDSILTVNCIVVSMEFRCWWKCCTLSWGRAVNVSSAYLFQKGSGSK